MEWTFEHPGPEGLTSSPDPSGPANARALADSRFGAQAILRLRVAFEHSTNPMLIADDQRRWVTGNDAACDLLGIAREEVPWCRMDDFTLPSERQELEEQWQRFLASGGAEGWSQLYVPDRGPVPVEFSATANVLPARHLSVFIPCDEASHGHDEASHGQAGDAQAHEAAWKPAIVESTGRLGLTEREREVMTFVASGLHSADIAERLFLSPETVKSHVHNAMCKLGAHTRAHGVAVALVTGQISWEI